MDLADNSLRFASERYRLRHLAPIYCEQSRSFRRRVKWIPMTGVRRMLLLAGPPVHILPIMLRIIRSRQTKSMRSASDHGSGKRHDPPL